MTGWGPYPFPNRGTDHWYHGSNLTPFDMAALRAVTEWSTGEPTEPITADEGECVCPECGKHYATARGVNTHRWAKRNIMCRPKEPIE
jgi:hypothetical protein